MNYLKYSSGIPSLMVQSHVSSATSNRGSSKGFSGHSHVDSTTMAGVLMPSNNNVINSEPPSRKSMSECSPILSRQNSLVIREVNDEGSMSEINEDEEDEIYDKSIPGSTNTSPLLQYSKSAAAPTRRSQMSPSPEPNAKASQTYLESSPALRNKRERIGSIDALRRLSQEQQASKPSALSGYKSKVQQIIQKMEEQQAQHFREQDEKSMAFRRRMDRLVYGDVKTKEQRQMIQPGVLATTSFEMEEEQTLTFGNYKEGTNRNLPDSTGEAQKYDVTKTQTPCTVSTKSSNESFCSITAKGTDDEDDVDVSHYRPETPPPSNQPQVVHVLQPMRSHDIEMQSRLEKLERLVDKLQFEKGGLESENEALRSLRASYKRRFAAEQQDRLKLENQVAFFKSSLEDVQERNRKLEADLEESNTIQRKQRTSHLVHETQWKHKTERVKRDFDKLWKDYKSSQAALKESLQSVEDLQNQLDKYRKQERKWEKEKTFLKDKVKHLQGKLSSTKATLNSVKEENNKE